MAEKRELNVLGFGLALGIITALYMFLHGLLAWLFAWGKPVVELMSALYIGYEATLLGSITGAVWAFVDFFIAGILIAWLYNKIQR